jgi:acetyl-CoA carboxylase carboxyltransferase component
MKTYQVQVHYQATGYFSITAENEEDAAQQAIRKAYSEHPEDLFAEVVNVEEDDEE